MPDINLLEEKEEADEKSAAKPKIPPARIEYSSPESKAEHGRLLKKPSTFSLWFRSLFRRPGAQHPRPTPPVTGEKSAPRRPSPDTTKSNIAEPEDIFADLPSYGGGPVKKPAGPSPQPPAPSGPKPGDFPPLPRMSEWTPTTGQSPRKPPATPRPPRPQTLGESSPSSSPLSPLISQIKRKPARQALRQRAPVAEEDAGVNLLPEELVVDFEPRKKLTTLGLVALAAALVVGVIDVSLLLWKETQVKKTREKEGEVAQTVQRIKALETEQRRAIALRSSTRTIRALLNTHIYWTEFLKKFEKYTLPTVIYPGGITTTFRAGITLTGRAPDIATITKQLAVYQQATDFIKTAKVENIIRNHEKGSEGTYNFIVDLTFVDEVYNNPVDALTAPTEIQKSQPKP
ncbi:MAG: hypothetical protein HY420_03000 [Candidatus Kerfeldbacteria bacterium]|nr:hypothetical protein [Candidatus Kerfeldbacteria bacterium]